MHRLRRRKRLHAINGLVAIFAAQLASDCRKRASAAGARALLVRCTPLLEASSTVHVAPDCEDLEDTMEEIVRIQGIHNRFVERQRSFSRSCRARVLGGAVSVPEEGREDDHLCAGEDVRKTVQKVEVREA